MRVPATSANLGSGFDSLGLALSLWDEVTARVVTGPTTVTVRGEGAGELPDDASHLVVTSLHTALRSRGVPAPSVKLCCHNMIPQARGLGSSSAAIVAGVLLASGLLGDDSVDMAWALEVADRIEGHPDNVAPCLLGGFTIAWTDATGRARAVGRQVVAGLNPVAYVPTARLLTARARAALPGDIPHRDAAHNIARAALAVHGFTRDAAVLWEATDDRVHQPYRAAAMPASAELVNRLRDNGIPAMISGAGPTVLAFGEQSDAPAGFTVRRLSVAGGAHLLHPGAAPGRTGPRRG